MRYFWIAAGIAAAFLVFNLLWYSVIAGGSIPFVGLLVAIGISAFWLMVIYAVIQAINRRA